MARNRVIPLVSSYIQNRKTFTLMDSDHQYKSQVRSTNSKKKKRTFFSSLTLNASLRSCAISGKFWKVIESHFLCANYMKRPLILQMSHVYRDVYSATRSHVIQLLRCGLTEAEGSQGVWFTQHAHL